MYKRGGEMRKIIYFFVMLIISLSFSNLFSQSTTLKVREKAFMKDERSITIKFSVGNGKADFNDVDVAQGDDYYFLCIPEGNWKVDKEFAKTFASKIFIKQDENVFNPESYNLVKIDDKDALIIGFKKNFSIEKPIAFNYQLSEKNVSTSVMEIPENLWKGYSAVYKIYQDAANFFKQNDYNNSVEAFYKVVENKEAAKFSFYQEAKNNCLKSLAFILTDLTNKFDSIAKSDLSPEDKINSYSELKTQVESFIKNTLTPKLEALADTDVSSIFSKANEYLAKIDEEIQKENLNLDMKNISWVKTETASNFKYRLLTDAIAYAFTSPSFLTNRDKTTFEFSIPDTVMANLKAFNLDKNFETFQRISITNLIKNTPLFEQDFISNLAKNSEQFSQPYYEVLSAVNNYFTQNYLVSKDYINKALKKLTDEQLINGIGYIWGLIYVTENNLSKEALDYFCEANKKLANGEKAVGLELLKKALLVDPNFPLANYKVAETYFKDNDYYPTITYISKALSVDPNFILLYKLLFEIYKTQNNWSEAQNLLESAIQKGNDFWIIRYLLGQVYNNLKAYDKAIENFMKAITYNRFNYEQYILIATIYSSSGKLAEAEKMLKTAAEIEPDRKEAYEEMKKLDQLKKK